jgi:hypothetical protein
MPFLLLTTKYTSAIDNDCVASVTTDICRIDNGIVKYHVTLLNTTVTFDHDNVTFLSTYPDSNDTRKGSPAGALQGLNHFAYNVHSHAHLSGPSVFNGDVLARMFSQTDPSAYYNTSAYGRCALLWIRPTDSVLNAMHDFMFRASMNAADDTDSQPFKVWQKKPTLVFHTLYRFPAAASIITLCGVFFLIRLQGWSLRRTVSLSPLETANAFCAPLMERTRYSSTTVDGILKDIGQIEVRYVDGVMVVNENSMSSMVEPLITHS